MYLLKHRKMKYYKNVEVEGDTYKCFRMDDGSYYYFIYPYAVNDRVYFYTGNASVQATSVSEISKSTLYKIKTINADGTIQTSEISGLTMKKTGTPYPQGDLVETKIESVESTPDDYDVAQVVGENYYSLKNEIKRYYKYVYNAWTQPKLTANGTLGGSSFACTASGYATSNYPYYALDNSTSTMWQNTNANNATFTFYNPKPLKVSKIVVTDYDSTSKYGIRQCYIEGSDDNSSWEKIFTLSAYNRTWNINSTKAFKYHRITITQGGTYNYYVDIKNFEITATEENISISTKDDYDYYIEADVAYSLCREKK